jgi:hypothetical protein
MDVIEDFHVELRRGCLVLLCLPNWNITGMRFAPSKVLRFPFSGQLKALE